MSAAATAPQQQFLTDLIRHSLFLPSGEPGLYGRGPVFEDVRTGVDRLIDRASEPDKPEKPRFPPFIPKRTMEKTGYLKSFPQLCGVVFSFADNHSKALDLIERADRGDDWSVHLSVTGMVLVPAACYPAYPAVALRGRLPTGGVTLDLGGCYVYRNEPSADPARLQVFHQREMVRIAEADEVIAWRETWMARAKNLFENLGLHPKIELASDPFFGRAGKLLARSQREQSLKFEVLLPVSSHDLTAVASFNFHREHFGSAFGIQLNDASTANSACLGFGLERITLALFKAHGFDLDKWPREVRERLWPVQPLWS